MVLSDFTGDHRLDALVVAQSDTTYNEGTYTSFLALFTGQAHGKFGQPRELDTPLAYDVLRVAVADFNRDGRPDFALTYESGPGRGDDMYPFLLVGMNKGRGRFRYPSADHARLGPDFTYAGDALTGDVNGDGKPDIVYGRLPRNGAFLDVRLGRGDGTFFAPATYAVDPQSSYRPVSPVDVTGDHRADFAFTTSDYNIGNALTVFPGQPSGFGSSYSQPLDTDRGSDALAAPADFNGDCITDFALFSTAGPQSNLRTRTSMLLGIGAGRFATPGPAVRTDVPTEVSDARAADVNRDGRPDLVLTSENNYLSRRPRLTVLLNTTRSFRRSGHRAARTR